MHRLRVPFALVPIGPGPSPQPNDRLRQNARTGVGSRAYRWVINDFPYSNPERVRSNLVGQSAMQRGLDEPLTFLWSGMTDEQLAQAGLVPEGNPNLRLARCAMAASLVCAHFTGRWISYSRDRNHYARLRRYEGLGYTYANVVRLVDEFAGAGSIVEDRAFPGRLGCRSRMKATDKLIDALGHGNQITPMPGELIRLRGANDELADYKDTPFTRAARVEVAALNEAFQSVSISLTSTCIDWNGIVVLIDGQFVHPARVTGYRVFNRCWKLGGRYYGPFWQNLPRKRRLDLAIDGEPVDEHDFEQLHPRLLYAEFGSQPDGDAYTIAGYEEQRDIVKRAWQIMINAQSRRSAVTALARELGGFRFQRQAMQMLTALENHHNRVAATFYTGAGLRLEWRDSELMMSIQRRCLSESIVALPVHDSLIAQRGGRSARVAEIMHDELHGVLSATR